MPPVAPTTIATRPANHCSRSRTSTSFRSTSFRSSTPDEARGKTAPAARSYRPSGFLFGLLAFHQAALSLNEDSIQHVFGQSSGEGVLLTWVVTAKDPDRCWIGNRKGRAVTEGWAGTRDRAAGVGECVDRGLPGDATERDHGAKVGKEQFCFSPQPLTAGVLLCGCWLVVGWCAVHGRGDTNLCQVLSVVSMRRGRLRCQAGSVQRGIQPVTAAISGEHPARAIGAVGAGREADDPDPRSHGAESRHRAAPVDLIAIGGSLLVCYLRAPLAQPRTFTAVDDLSIEFLDRGDRLDSTSEVASQGSRYCVARRAQRCRPDRHPDDRR